MSSKDCTLESIPYLIGSNNDENDWINGFFEDYDRFYYEAENLGVYSNLIAGIPIILNFSSKDLKRIHTQECGEIHGRHQHRSGFSFGGRPRNLHRFIHESRVEYGGFNILKRGMINSNTVGK